MCLKLHHPYPPLTHSKHKIFSNPVTQHFTPHTCCTLRDTRWWRLHSPCKPFSVTKVTLDFRWWGREQGGKAILYKNQQWGGEVMAHTSDSVPFEFVLPPRQPLSCCKSLLQSLDPWAIQARRQGPLYAKIRNRPPTHNGDGPPHCFALKRGRVNPPWAIKSPSLSKNLGKYTSMPHLLQAALDGQI